MNPRQRKRPAGFSLIEVILGGFLLVIGAVALMQALPIGLAAVTGSRQQTHALEVATARMERVKAWGMSNNENEGFDTIVPGGRCYTFVDREGMLPPGPCAPGSAAGYRWEVTVGVLQQIRGIPNRCRPSQTQQFINVEVFFRPMRDNGIASGDQSVALATLIACRNNCPVDLGCQPV